jgi:hypothetical protein
MAAQPFVLVASAPTVRSYLGHGTVFGGLTTSGGVGGVGRYNARALQEGGGEDFIQQNWIPRWLWNVLPPAESSE